jgi:hypothetical protein
VARQRIKKIYKNKFRSAERKWSGVRKAEPKRRNNGVQVKKKNSG